MRKTDSNGSLWTSRIGIFIIGRRRRGRLLSGGRIRSFWTSCACMLRMKVGSCAVCQTSHRTQLGHSTPLAYSYVGYSVPVEKSVLYNRGLIGLVRCLSSLFISISGYMCTVDVIMPSPTSAQVIRNRNLDATKASFTGLGTSTGHCATAILSAVCSSAPTYRPGESQLMLFRSYRLGDSV